MALPPYKNKNMFVTGIHWTKAKEQVSIRFYEYTRTLSLCMNVVVDR